jgi:hypothetical protein
VGVPLLTIMETCGRGQVSVPTSALAGAAVGTALLPVGTAGTRLGVSANCSATTPGGQPSTPGRSRKP